ncbi:uncharacterized protein MYCFIDRAFT_175717 [Pseudocercospora fijiensis CIRAD86]|uniref:Uncharacterized protein n=1 Tax=Pseudocercospora fijiensis (strain CIRAD86) TaxID=383855 RepID=M3AYD3_PSEFD|nr:uncharacterized protein MYCFIDRAFT_175717 [Pseudocercospora fijiensis CIRAD86]EME82178.1 hypothetical protein MYCFIDRAFT_175717 [Pseudocercospora fijiensis CIRAD86]
MLGERGVDEGSDEFENGGDEGELDKVDVNQWLTYGYHASQFCALLFSSYLKRWYQPYPLRS